MSVGVCIFTIVTVIFTPMSVVFALLAVPKDSVLVDRVGDKGRLVGIVTGKLYSITLTLFEGY